MSAGPGPACLATILLAVAAAPAAAVDEITVLGLFRDRAVLAIDGARRVLRAGETSPEGVRLVEADSEAAVVEVAGERRRLGLGTHIGARYAPPPDPPSVRIWPDASRMYEVTGSINGFPVRFIVDTGATLVSMNAPQARRLGIAYRLEGEPATSSTAAGLARVYLVRLDRVKVGPIELDGVPAAVHEGNFPTRVLLGMSFLGRLDMRRDGRALVLRKRF